jgi:hypothetical protein
MKYALWDLVEDSPNYLTGPESKIAELGGRAEASWTNGIVEQGADILGYVTGDFDAEELSHWNYREVDEAEALAFCKAIDPNAYLLPDGKITTTTQE